MSDLENRLPKPPEPPRMPRRVRLHRFQWIGLPIILLAPIVLAVAGVFGESWETVEADAAGFRVVVDYPVRFRYKQLNEIRVAIESRSLGPADTVMVSVDTTYARGFSTITSTPAFERPYTTRVGGLRPGERGLVMIELQAERYGAHAGDLVVAAADTVRVRLRTVVFP